MVEDDTTKMDVRWNLFNRYDSKYRLCGQWALAFGSQLLCGIEREVFCGVVHDVARQAMVWKLG